MEDNKNVELKNNLLAILGKILNYVQEIQQSLDHFRKNNEAILTKSNIEDLNVITANNVVLIGQLHELSKMDKIDSGAELKDFLAHARHTLHNTINIIMGYTELLLSDFKRRESNECAQTLYKIILIINDISALTNQLKMADASEIEFENFLMLDLEKDLEPKEYGEFKRDISILIVDDLVENCKLLERYLNQIGYAKTTVRYDGYQALKLIKKTRFDLILLDIDMPKISGKEVLTLLKEDLIKDKFSVIMISGYESVNEMIECIQLGAQDLITKPFNVELLRVRINACVERKWCKHLEMVYHVKYEKLKKYMVRSYYVLSFLGLFLRM